jgi:hypothetical protein
MNHEPKINVNGKKIVYFFFIIKYMTRIVYIKLNHGTHRGTGTQ